MKLAVTIGVMSLISRAYHKPSGSRSYQDTRVYGTPSRLDQRQSPLRLANRRRVGWRQPRLDQPLLIRDRQPHWIAEHSTISSSIFAMVISSNSHATLTGHLTKLASLVQLGRRAFLTGCGLRKGTSFLLDEKTTEVCSCFQRLQSPRHPSAIPEGHWRLPTSSRADRLR